MYRRSLWIFCKKNNKSFIRVCYDEFQRISCWNFWWYNYIVWNIFIIITYIIEKGFIYFKFQCVYFLHNILYIKELTIFIPESKYSSILIISSIHNLTIIKSWLILIYFYIFNSSLIYIDEVKDTLAANQI